MTLFKGRDLLLKIGDGEDPEVFTTLGVARAVSMTLDNKPLDVTSMDAGGMQELDAQGGLQSLRIVMQGLFKNAAAEELLRTAAFTRTADNYELYFPNGDKYAAAFVAESYVRTGSYDGLETFAVTLSRSGAGVYTPEE